MGVESPLLFGTFSGPTGSIYETCFSALLGSPLFEVPGALMGPRGTKMELKGGHFGALGRERRESVNRAGTQARASKTRFRRGREGLFFQVFFRPLPGRSPGGEDSSFL